MWKNSHTGTFSISSAAEPSHPEPVLPAPLPVARPAVAAAAQSSIGKDLIFMGEITGADSLESLFIDGSVEGNIILPCSRVTVGLSGQVKSCIAARDIVVMGKVLGNIAASNCVDIRALGTVIGDVSAPRISIEDGAFVKGSLEVIAAEVEPAAAASPVVPAPLEMPRKIVVQSEAGNPQAHRSLQTA